MVPETDVRCGSFVFDQGAEDGDSALTPCSDLPAGKVHGGVLGIVTGQGGETLLGKGVDDSPDAGPVDGAGAHRAGFRAGVERGVREFLQGTQSGGLCGGGQLCMLGGVPLGRHRIVALACNDLALSVNDERREGMTPVVLGCLGEGDDFPEEVEIGLGRLWIGLVR